MECDCKITGTPGHHIMEPCVGHLEWMQALVRGERDACARIADMQATTSDAAERQETAEIIACAIRAREPK